MTANARTRRKAGRSGRGFSLVELAVAAAVLFIAAVGVLEALAAAVRNSDRHQKDMVAERLILSAIGYMRDVGFDQLVASGSNAVTGAISSIYSPELGQLGPTAAVSVVWLDSGQLLDATVSATFPVANATASLAMATKIGEGSPP